MPKRADAGATAGSERFQIGDYYLDQPHPDRGGYWYACRYDTRGRRVRRRSLETADREQAKIALATLVATAPQAAREGAAAPGQVLTLAVLKAYLDERAPDIASQELADRAGVLFGDWLADIKRLDASVAFWTPAQQMECARWLHRTHDHSAGYIARLFNVLRSAVNDAATVRMRTDALGNRVEAALISSAPPIGMAPAAIATELKIPLRKRPRPPTPSIEDMARVLDAIESEHLFRFAIISLCTWARPEAVTDFDPTVQVDWNAGELDLAPPGWVPTNKKRARQPVTACLGGWLQAWRAADEARNAADRAKGRTPREAGLIVWKRRRVKTVKRAFRRIGAELEIAGFTQKSFRHFMTDQVKRLFRIPREYRSRWLAHVVRQGSETTSHYEADEPQDLLDVALATDCIIALIAEHARQPLFAIEPRLNRKGLTAIGARRIPKKPAILENSGGCARDRTWDPYRVEVLRIADYRAKPTKKSA